LSLSAFGQANLWTTIEHFISTITLQVELLHLSNGSGSLAQI